MAGEASVSEAVAALGLSTCPKEPVEVLRVHDWTRAGSETYIYAFDLRWASGSRTELLLKAFVPAPPVSVEVAVDRTWSNFVALSNSGVAVPKHFGAHSGTVLCERVRWSLQQQLERDRDQTEILRSALATVFRLPLVGFRPIFGSWDFYSDGVDAKLVDLGDDLGRRGEPTLPLKAAEAGGWFLSRYGGSIRLPDSEVHALAAATRPMVA